MIRLGLRLTVNGGREAITRLVLLVVSVGVGVGLLLVAVAGINAVNIQIDKYAWLGTGYRTDHAAAAHRADPLWFDLQTDTFQGRTIGVVQVAATGPSSPVPPGISHVPGPGQYYASPAMTALLRSTPATELGDRYAGHQIGIVGEAALSTPNALLIIVGNTAAQMAHTQGAVHATSINTTPLNGCPASQCLPGEGVNSEGVDLILSVVALAILFPLLIFIGTATRLSAARREQRFAAMRLAGASPRQISVIAAVESTVAAVLGVAIGFGLFFALRIPLAAIPFTGAPFFPSEMSLSLADIVAVAIGVPVASAAAARLALRRVSISPLGVTRRVRPDPVRPWRILPLLAGLAELTFFAGAGRPASASGQIQAFMLGFLLVMVGLVLAGPWLTMTGARLLARRTSRPGALIAARRLADDPRAGFRAVSGLVLALFITTVAVVLISTQDAKGPSGIPVRGALSNDTLFDSMNAPQVIGPAASASLTARLRAIHGVTGVALVVRAPVPATVPSSVLGLPAQQVVPAGLVSCAELAQVPAFGRCPSGARVAAVAPWNWDGPETLPDVVWTAANVPASRLDRAGTELILVATDGSVQAVETARTVLDLTYPAAAATTFTEAYGEPLTNAYQQLADVVVLISLVIAGSTLATAVASGLADRKRPFSLLRLAGTPLRMLQQVVALESAVPLLVTAAVSIGAGFAASAAYAEGEMQVPVAGPDPAYYIITATGIVLSLGVIASTMPLLRRITSPEVARNE